MNDTVVSLPRLSITRLHGPDLADAAELIHRCWHDAYARQLPAKRLSERTQAFWLDYLRERQANYWIARLGKRAAGVVGIASNCIDDLWVARRYRGRGVGRRLVQTAMDELSERGFSFAQAGCEDFNEDAVGFFRHLDWALIGREPMLGLVPGRQVEALVFSRPLRRSPAVGMPG